jgi:predicted amidophosphoribosyltransferase
MPNVHPRMVRERRTIAAMIRIYCRGNGHPGRSDAGLCPECEALRSYAWRRLERCPFQEGKTTCARCPVHCYNPEQRERVRAVMRYAGPRMLARHPFLAVQHLADRLRKEPVPRPSARAGRTERKQGVRRRSAED